MLIIPVIDLKDGQVVHAKQGLRESYSPIESILSNRADPNAVLSGFFKLYPFKVIYIADLDAIMRNGSNYKVIIELAYSNQQCHFWVDAGMDAFNKPELQHNNIKLVLGSENKLAENEFKTVLSNHRDPILSLDFIEGELKENHYLLNNTNLWPDNIITMMLSRVGSDKGIDWACLKKVITTSNDKNVYAAGGVQDINDLKELKSFGIKGVLLASALHSGAITKEGLENFLKK